LQINGKDVTLYWVPKPKTSEALHVEWPDRKEQPRCRWLFEKEYLGHPEETARTLRTHDDGLTWVYTGDLGTMDDEGFVYFKGRAKRLIVTSGYNVYPNQIENVLDAHELVHMSCVIGVPDDYRMHRVKAFIVLKDGVPPTDETRQLLLEHCAHYVARYAMPREIEFRSELPKTLVGKVAYRQLEEEAKQAP
ncbi:MAG: AMP-binding protein, partial [Butyricicoccus sp.]|nr:AMP-binding protein [Butyricicoccus sp.]